MLGLTGAAPITKDLLATWLGFGIVISEAFGMTETHAIIAYTPPGEARAGTVGKPIPGIEIKVADDGELLVKGPNVFGGYLNRDEATAETLQGGWLHTKILAVLLLSGLHGYLSAAVRKFAEDRNERPAKHWRIVNEIPTLLMIVIVVLVVVKPF